MFDPQWLRQAEAERVAVRQQTLLDHVEGIGAGLEFARGKAGPAAPSGQRAGPAATEIVPRLGVEEQSGCPAAAEYVRHTTAEQRLLLLQPAEAERDPVRPEATIAGDAGEAIRRSGRAGLHVLPNVACFAGHGDADAAELPADSDAAVALGREARITRDVAGNQE